MWRKHVTRHMTKGHMRAVIYISFDPGSFCSDYTAAVLRLTKCASERVQFANPSVR
jgi:hypothetical protein